MDTAQQFIDFARRQVNKFFKLDVVRVSGQYTLKSHIALVLEKYSVDAIIDVGSNEGDFGLLMRSVGFKGTIYSFEPVASAFAVLADRAKRDGNWRVFDFALGSSEGFTQINVSRFSQFSSILDATSYGNSWENMKVEYRQDIAIRTLDNVFAEGLLGDSNRYFLKMDTQGYDVEVFKGSLNFRSKVCCLLSELSLIPVYERMPSYMASLKEFNESGFVASGFYPITRHPSLALNEVDCMMVRPGSIASVDVALIAPH